MVTVAPFAVTATVRAPSRGTSVPRLSRRVALDLVASLDAIATVASGLVPAAIYARVGHLQVDWTQTVQSCLVTALLVHLCLRYQGHYDTARIHQLPVDPVRLAAAVGLAFISVLGLGLPFGMHQGHLWAWYASWTSTSFFLLLAIRVLARNYLAALTQCGAFDTRVAVYGAGAIADRVADYLSTPALGIRFAGLYDDRRNPARGAPAETAVNGGLEDLIASARSDCIDQVIIALPQAAERRTQEVADRLQQLPVSLHVCTHLESDLIDAGPAHRVSSLGPVGLLDVKSKPLADWGVWLKGAEDYVLGTLLLVLAAPLLALIALLVRLDSRGPALVAEQRRGLNRRVINVLKFRTAHVTADGAGGLESQPTRVGRYLRRSRLDRLPQLFSVLKGEMSLVGPESQPASYDDACEEVVRHAAHGYQMKPGLTGLAHVRACAGPAATPEQLRARAERDAEYVASWSLALDLEILFRSLGMALRGCRRAA